MASEDVLNRLRDFSVRRDWGQFHSEANLAKSICIEAAELLECFQWNSAEYDEERVREELADVLTYCFFLADKLGADPEQVILDKLKVSESKYPVEKARGRADKYDRL